MTYSKKKNLEVGSTHQYILKLPGLFQSAGKSENHWARWWTERIIALRVRREHSHYQVETRSPELEALLEVLKRSACYVLKE